MQAGSRILSDSCASYRSLYRSSLYEHDEVNHFLNFVNPDDITVHTQNVESIWRHSRKNWRISMVRAEDFLMVI